LWGVNPDTGKLRWYVVAGRGDSMCGSAIVHDGVAYVLGERGGQMVAVKGGGKGDVTGSHVLWAKNYQGRISTPVAADGLIYIPAGGSLLCVDAATGDEVYNERLEEPASESTAQAEGENRGDRGGGGFGGGGGGFGGRRGGRGGRGGFTSSDYSSPVIADGKIFFVRRQGAVHVVKTGREFEQLGVNKFEGEADYSASPAVSNGDLFIRSSKKLYCVANSD
jgi:outer membrane protein assembly factor BamB